MSTIKVHGAFGRAYDEKLPQPRRLARVGSLLIRDRLSLYIPLLAECKRIFSLLSAKRP